MIRRAAAPVLSVFAFLAFAAPALAQGAHQGHGAQPSGASSPAAQAFEAVNAKMHKDMAIAYTGDADRDFLLAMLPHHQGAVDMARVVLQYGKDPKVRELARDIIEEQEEEIAEIRRLLAR